MNENIQKIQKNLIKKLWTDYKLCEYLHDNYIKYVFYNYQDFIKNNYFVNLFYIPNQNEYFLQLWFETSNKYIAYICYKKDDFFSLDYLGSDYQSINKLINKLDKIKTTKPIYYKKKYKID